MKGVFGPVYAQAYDALYQDKDYASECDLLERIFKQYAHRPVQTFLDLGCGTGGHAVILGKRGYQGAGIDRSKPMLAKARLKILDSPVVFHEGDLRDINLERKFDVALMLFAVLGYQIEDQDINRALRVAGRHLREGGLFIFDAWYGPAVLKQKPEKRLKILDLPKGRLVRAAHSELDLARHLCHVHYVLNMGQDGQTLSETSEIHTMRYFFAEELQIFLKEAGLALIRLGAFPDFNQPPSGATWNVLGVARKLKAP